MKKLLSACRSTIVLFTSIALFQGCLKDTATRTYTFLRLIFVATLLTLSTVNCKKTIIENPFAEITTLDCRNLLIRSISLKDTIVEITIENTCKNCPANNSVYNSILIRDRQTGDTLNSPQYHFWVPQNEQVMTYKFPTHLTTLPDLNTLQFDFSRLCIDLTYSP